MSKNIRIRDLKFTCKFTAWFFFQNCLNMKNYRFPNKISAVLFDIDGTLTYRPDQHPSWNEKGGLACVSGGQTPNALENGIRMFSDAPPTIRTLHSAGFELYTATTNASSVALEKLALGKLAEGNTSPYFRGVLGGEELSPGGKTSALFFHNLLKHYKLDPSMVLHVGDDPVLDVLCPLEAGIRHVAQINRSQKESVRTLDSGGISINRLELLPELLGIENLACK